MGEGISTREIHVHVHTCTCTCTCMCTCTCTCTCISAPTYEALDRPLIQTKYSVGGYPKSASCQHCSHTANFAVEIMKITINYTQVLAYLFLHSFPLFLSLLKTPPSTPASIGLILRIGCTIYRLCQHCLSSMHV